MKIVDKFALFLFPSKERQISTKLFCLIRLQGLAIFHKLRPRLPFLEENLEWSLSPETTKDYPYTGVYQVQLLKICTFIQIFH